MPNKTTTAIKEALIEAFGKLGGVPSLVAWGQEHPTEFYKLWARMAPQEMEHAGAGGGPLTVQVVYSHE